MSAGSGGHRFGIRVGLTLAFIMVSLIAFASAADADADETTKTGDLEISVSSLESDKGVLIVVLLNSAEQFDDGDQMFRSNEKVSIKGRKANVTFKSIPYGSYAVKTFHDENSNGKLDTNFVGFPKEGFGFSNDAMGKFGPPSFEQAEFAFAAEKLRIEIKSK